MSRAGPARPSPAVYRRRRIVALLILLAVIGGIAWGVRALLSGDEEPPAGSSAPDAEVRVAAESRAASPDSDDGGDAADSDGEAPGDGEAAGDAEGATDPEDSAAEPPAPGEVVACVAGNLSLEAGADPSSPAAGTPVTFELIVRNEGHMPCLLEAGPAELVVEVTSGNDPVWSSAHCADGGNELLLDVEAHYTIPVRWNGQRSVEGCAGGQAFAAAGTYRAAVVLNGAPLPSSEAVVLDLR